MLNSNIFVMIIAIFAALLPAGLLFRYIYRQDSANPEPVKWLWKSVLYGVLSAIVAIFLAFPVSLILDKLQLPGVLGSSITAFFAAAIPEEAAKMLLLCLVLRKNPHFDEHLDGVVYATCVGLGFASFENILYIIQNLSDFVLIAIMRGLFSVPAHFFLAVTMGYYISMAHFASVTVKQKRKYFLLAYFIPVVLHGIFDTLLLSTNAIPAVSGLIVLVFLYFCNRVRKASQKRIQDLKNSDGNIAM